MILLFGEKATAKANSTRKHSNVKNNPVENSGILAMNGRNPYMLNSAEYDTYSFSTQYPVDYSLYSDDGGYYISNISFLSSFEGASDASFSAGASFGGFSGGGDCCASSCGGGGFSSVC